jgi:hypothetical protein
MYLTGRRWCGKKGFWGFETPGKGAALQGGGPQGLKSLRENPKKKPQISLLRYALPKNISTEGPRNRRSLRFAPNHKEENGRFQWELV